MSKNLRKYAKLFASGFREVAKQNKDLTADDIIRMLELISIKEIEEWGMRILERDENI